LTLEWTGDNTVGGWQCQAQPENAPSSATEATEATEFTEKYSVFMEALKMSCFSRFIENWISLFSVGPVTSVGKRILRMWINGILSDRFSDRF
jgi:hypothetical protein